MYRRKPPSSMLCPYFTYLERNHVLQLYKNCFLCSKSCLKDVNPTKQAEIGERMKTLFRREAKKKKNPYLPGVSLKHTSQFVLCINDRAQAESDSLILLQSGSDRSKCKVDQADEN